MKRNSRPILKVIADWRYGERPREAKTEYDQISREELDNNSWWYLHGSLSDMTGYDKGYAVNCKTLGISKWNEHHREWQMHWTGEILVRIEGIKEMCMGYFWVTEFGDESWEQRGLVCLMSDQEGREYAEKKYREKAKGL